MFFRPPAPARAEPKQESVKEPDGPPPPPTIPKTYGGPAVIAAIGDQVWFKGKDRLKLRVGEERSGVNHIGFLVDDIEDKLESFSKEIPIAPRPASRPYAEYRVRDPEQNGVDLSKGKGWEVDLGKWENGM